MADQSATLVSSSEPRDEDGLYYVGTWWPRGQRMAHYYMRFWTAAVEVRVKGEQCHTWDVEYPCPEHSGMPRAQLRIAMQLAKACGRCRWPRRCPCGGHLRAMHAMHPTPFVRMCKWCGSAAFPTPDALPSPTDDACPPDSDADHSDDSDVRQCEPFSDSESDCDSDTAAAAADSGHSHACPQGWKQRERPTTPTDQGTRPVNLAPRPKRRRISGMK